MWKHRGARLWLLCAIAALLAGSAIIVACTPDEQGKKAGAAGAGKNHKPGGDEPAATPSGDGEDGNKVAVKSGTKYVGEDAVANAGTIKGTVTYKGSQKAGTLAIDKDTEVCKHGGESNEIIVASADGKLKNAVIYIEGIAKGKKWENDKVEVDNHECMFHPRVQLLPNGGAIVAKNSDPVLHNTNLTLKLNGTGKTLANIALPKQGQTAEKKMKKAGVVSVTCDVHKWMQAYVFVSDNPYVAVSGDDGTFEIDEVPAGEYVAKIWHETLGEKEAKVKVDAGGQATLDIAFD